MINEYTLSINKAELGVISSALIKMPYEEVAMLIQKLKKQIDLQEIEDQKNSKKEEGV